MTQQQIENVANRYNRAASSMGLPYRACLLADGRMQIRGSVGSPVYRSADEVRQMAWNLELRARNFGLAA